MSIGAPQYGGFNAQTLSDHLVLTAGDDAYQAIDPGGSARNVDLPDLGTSGRGMVVVDNTADAAEVITLRDVANSNATVGTPAQNESAVCHFSEGTWVCVVGAAN